MPTVNMQTLQDALKLFYLPSIQQQMNDTVNPFYSEVERSSEEVYGSKIKMAMSYGASGGIGMRAEDGDLPTPNARKIKQVEMDTKNLYARLMITEKIIRASANNAGAFAKVLEMQINDTLTDAKLQYGRMLFGDGTGKIATCTAQTTVNNLVVDNVQYLKEGMLIDIRDLNGTIKSAEREITMVDTATKTITISGTAITTLATDIITVAGNYGLELTGLGAIFANTGSIYGVDRATNKWIVPNMTAVGGEIDELKIQTGIDNAEIKAGSKIDFMICSYGVRRAYQYLMASQKRNIDIMELKGGWKVMSYNGIALDADRFCPSGTLYQLSKGDFVIHQMGEWDFLDRDGNILHRVANKPSFEATLVKYGDLGCRRPAGQSVLTGITEH